MTLQKLLGRESPTKPTIRLWWPEGQGKDQAYYPPLVSGVRKSGLADRHVVKRLRVQDFYWFMSQVVA